MTEYATVFEFNSKAELDNDKDVALIKVVKPPVVYYSMSVSYYELFERTHEGPVWKHLHKRPRFELNAADSLVFYFIDCQQAGAVEAVGTVVEFNQEIGPFDDEVAAEIRMAGAGSAQFITVDSEDRLEAPKDAFELKPSHSKIMGFKFETAGRYSYTTAVITFPDRRKYWHDPEMDVDT